MQNLIRFFIRFHYLFLFLFLQVFALAIYIQSHYYQRATFINSANAVSGNMYETVSNVENYFQLSDENSRLTEENARLEGLSDVSLLKMQDDYILKDDTLYQQQYIFSSAKVINASIHRKNNYLTINKGKGNGVFPDQAVIGPLGVVGITKDVSEHFSTVVPIINTKYNLDVHIKRNKQIGTVSWNNQEGLDAYHAHIVDIPITAKILPGDTLETSGYSKKYPKGVRVGVVTEVEELPETSSLKVTLKLFTDYSQVNNVLVVKNLMREEWEELEKEFGE